MSSDVDHPDVEEIAAGGQQRITSLLAAWRHGDVEAEARLMEAVYPVMRDIAHSRLRHAPSDMTLDTSDLANEAYARLTGIRAQDWESRLHFFAVAARIIRNIVVDHLRARSSEKRGGDLPFVALQDIDVDTQSDGIDLGVDWLSVHAALEELDAVDHACARIVELKFFSGLTNEEIAEAVGSSRATVVRNWRFSRAWLADRLESHRVT
jgi:RNA polymerase sigma factor (TIGR02999 family)